MKICFILSDLFSKGGIERVTSVLASKLVEKHDVTIYCMDKPENENRSLYSLSPNVHVEFVENLWKKHKIRRLIGKVNLTTGIFDKACFLAVLKWVYLPKDACEFWYSELKDKNFDCVIATQGRLSMFLAEIAPRLTCKTIGWQHNSYEAYLCTKGKYYWGQKALFEYFIPRLSAYIVLNEHDEEMYRNKHSLMTKTIYNPKSFECEMAADIFHEKFIAAGGFREAKGFDLLIESFSIFAKKNNSWKLEIYGDGPDKVLLEKKIEEYDLKDRVLLPGFTDHIQEKMLESGTYLLSSRWEGMPMVILEALELGLPIVSFGIQAVVPLVDDNKEGLIVEPFDCVKFADAMLKIACDSELRLSMSKNAKTKAKEFSVDKIAENWEQIFCS